MVEYIEKEAAQKIICGWCGVCKSPTVCDLMHCDDICPQFAQIPAADVRPVVLCRDCLHYEMGVCLKIYDDGAANKDAWQDRKPDDFCSYGEKREES